jgi:peptide deformylase
VTSVFFQKNFKLLTYGAQTDGVLSKPVEESDWDDIPRLFEYMVEVMRKADGMGLAAPQIGCFKQFMLMEMPNRSVIGLINPEITRLYGAEVRGLEWCSNVPPPGNECVVPRMGKVDIEASLAGSPGVRRKLTFKGSEARIIQHEIDHLNGTFFVDRIPEEHKKKAVLENFNNWKAMRRAQIRTREENGNVKAGAAVAAHCGKSYLS